MSCCDKIMHAAATVTGCECDPSEPGHCAKHGCWKTATWKRLCRQRPDYFALWERGEGPNQRAKQVVQPDEAQDVSANDIPCQFRGQLLKIGSCDLCGIKGQPFEIIACEQHGECSLTRRHSKVRSCLACEDRLA